MNNAIIPESIPEEMTCFVVGFEKLSSYPTKGDHKFSKRYLICIKLITKQN